MAQPRDWLDDQGIGDLEYIERGGHGMEGYHLTEYTQEGYARYILEECFSGPEWDSKNLSDGYIRHKYSGDEVPDDIQVTAEINDSEFWLYMPELEKDTQLNELTAVLAGGPFGMPNPHRSGATYSPAVTDIEFILNWHFNPQYTPAYSF